MPIGIVKPEMLKKRTEFGCFAVQKTQPFKYYTPTVFYNSTTYSTTEKILHFQNCQNYLYRVNELLKPIIELQRLNCEIEQTTIGTKTWSEICELYVDFMGILQDFRSSDICEIIDIDELRNEFEQKKINKPVEYFESYDWFGIYQSDYKLMEDIKNHQYFPSHLLYTVDCIKKELSNYLKEIHSIDLKSKEYLKNIGIETYDSEKAMYIFKDKSADFFDRYERREREELGKKLSELINYQRSVLRELISIYITSERFFSNRKGTSYLVIDASTYKILFSIFSGNLVGQEEDEIIYCRSITNLNKLKEFVTSLLKTSDQISGYIEELERRESNQTEPNIVIQEDAFLGFLKDTMPPCYRAFKEALKDGKILQMKGKIMLKKTLKKEKEKSEYYLDKTAEGVYYDFCFKTGAVHWFFVTGKSQKQKVSWKIILSNVTSHGCVLTESIKSTSHHAETKEFDENFKKYF